MLIDFRLFLYDSVEKVLFKADFFFSWQNSKFYRRHYELASKFNVGLKPLLHQGLSKPEFYGDIVNKLKKQKKKKKKKKIEGRADFSVQFRKNYPTL